MGFTIRARGLTTLPDSTSQKFLLLGVVPKDGKSGSQNRVVIVYLDFANTRKKKCGENDFEKWYARPPGSRACLMGHKVWRPSEILERLLTPFSNGTNGESPTLIAMSARSSMTLLNTKKIAHARRMTTNGTFSDTSILSQLNSTAVITTLFESTTNASQWDQSASLPASVPAIRTKNTWALLDSARFPEILARVV